MKKISIGIIGALLFLSIRVDAQNIQPFKKGDRIAFVGNSITHGGHYHSYVWLYYMTHFPDRRIEIFNCGIGGDVIGNINKRLESDVFKKNPSVIFLTFGMNDAGYYEYLKPNASELAAEKVDTSYHNFLKVVKKLKKVKAKKIMMSSPPFDETAKLESAVFPGKNKAMLKIADFQKAIARKNNWGFIDLNRPMTAINLREQKKDSSFTLEGEGRIHPDNDGHLVMTYLILKSQGLAGKKVANVDIDVSKRKVKKTINSFVSNLKVSRDGISFNYLAQSLPYPIDTVVRGWGEKKAESAALPVIPFMKEYNNERLVVRGLPGEEYLLKMDGNDIGRWSSQELSKGINLAKQTRTPEYRQALAIMELNEERWEIEKKMRDYLWMEYSFLQGKGMLFKDNLSAVDTVRKAAKENPFVRGNMGAFLAGHFKSVRQTWKEQMKLIVDEIYQINKPVAHQVELKKIR